MRLSYEIATTGVEQLRSVLRGVEREAAASDKRLETGKRASAQRVAREQMALMQGPGRKEQTASIRARERAEAMATARAMREKAAAQRLEQRQQLGIIKSEERARIQSERNLQRARESLDRQRARGLMQLHQQSERAAAKLSAGRRATAERIGSGFAQSVRGGVGSTLALGSTALGVAGGFATAGALREESDVRRRASALANKAGDPSAKDALAEEATHVRGFTGSETLEAMDKMFGKTGDLGVVRAAIKDLGDLTIAVDANFGEMGQAAGNAFNVIADRIKDPQKRVEALQRTMAGWAGQGNIGTVELSDMASLGGRLGGASRKFAGDPVKLLLSMGAMAQAAARAGGASDAAEATTGVARFAADLTKKPAQKALDRLGVKVFADKNHQFLKDPQEILASILDKTKGSLSLGEEIMNAESGKVLSGFSEVWTNAEAQKKGSGHAAVLGEFERYNKAALSPEMRTAQANSRMADPDMQFKEATKAFNAAVGRDLLPAVTRLVPQFTAMIPNIANASSEVAKFVGWFAENPVKGVGVVIAASVAKDVASAGISAALSSGVSSLVGSMTTAQIGMAKFAGASAFAAAAIYAAYDQNESLKKETGGKGILDVGWEWATTDKGLKEIADENLDKQARERAIAEGRVPAPGMERKLRPPGIAPPGSPPLNATSNQAEASLPAPARAPAQAPEATAATSKAGVDLQEAAKALKAAAAAMPKGPNAPDASRTAPIISSSR